MLLTSKNAPSTFAVGIACHIMVDAIELNSTCNSVPVILYPVGLGYNEYRNLKKSNRSKCYAPDRIFYQIYKEM